MKSAFSDEMKSIIHHFLRAFIEVNRTIFIRRRERDFKT